jgi:hypothetical protein
MKWTPQEDNILISSFENSPKSEIIQKLNKPWIVIYRRAYTLKLHRNKNLPKIEKKPSLRKDSYSPQEISLLSSSFNNPKNIILNQFKKAGFNRSWLSILYNAKKLGLKRNPTLIKKDKKKSFRKKLNKSYCDSLTIYY